MRWNSACRGDWAAAMVCASSQAKGKQALPTRLAATAGDIIYFEWDVPFAPVRSPDLRVELPVGLAACLTELASFVLVCMQHAGSSNVFLLPSPEAFRASDFSNAMFLSDKSPFVYVTPPHAMARPLHRLPDNCRRARCVQRHRRSLARQSMRTEPPARTKWAVPSWLAMRCDFAGIASLMAPRGSSTSRAGKPPPPAHARLPLLRPRMPTPPY